MFEMKIKRSKAEQAFNIFNIILMFVLMVVTLYPLLYVLFASLSDASKLMQHSGLLFKPLGLNLSSYKIVIQDRQILSGYMNTIIVVVAGVLISMVLTILGAYTLSRKNLYWGKMISMIVIIPMFFSGGLIPFYLLVKNLGMLDSLWALILPTALSTYNMMIMRTALAGVPVDATGCNKLLSRRSEEAAEIDGANPLVVLFRILIPLTIPTIAVLILYYAVANWNSWFNAMLFLPKAKEKWPLQLVLRNLLIQNQTDDLTSGVAAADKFSVSETIKYATIIVSTLPILCLYPFLQKYFLKGVMVGSVKG